MEKSGKTNKLVYFLIGTISGVVIGIMVLLAAGFAYVMMKQGQGFSVSLFPSQSATVSSSKEKEELVLTIDPQVVLRTVDPMIYGSNLSAKMEFEMDVAQFGKETGVTNFRFPGGGSEGYHWQEGVFEFENRSNTAPLAKLGNVIKFCHLVGAKLVVQVNVESGTPEEAAAWVDHMNRKENFRVDYWELGNEVYGDWDKAYMTGEQYAEVVKAYSQAMKAVDPTIKIGANFGGPNFTEFDEALMRLAHNDFDFISFHWYPNHINPDKPFDGRTHPYPEEVMANAMNVPVLVERFRNLIRKYAPERVDKIEIGFLEWDGSWDGAASDLKNEYRGVMWSLANAIFYADTLGQMATHGVALAQQFTFQEGMFGLIPGWDKQAGWGGGRWDGKTVRPKALALKLYARYFGDQIIHSELKGSGYYEKKNDFRADSYVGKVPYATVYASKSSDGKRIVIALVNKHAQAEYQVKVNISHADLEPDGMAYLLSGEDLAAQNDGNPGAVAIRKFRVKGVDDSFTIDLPARSVKMIELSVKN